MNLRLHLFLPSFIAFGLGVLEGRYHLYDFGGPIGLQVHGPIVSHLSANRATSSALLLLKDQSAFQRLLLDRKFELLEERLRAAGMQDPIGALSWAATLPQEQQSAARCAIVSGWYLAEPLAAMKWASENDPGYFSTDDFAESAVKLGRIDYAMQGAAQIYDKTVSHFQVQAMFAGFANADLDRTISAVQELPAQDRSGALIGALPVLAAHSPSAAIDMADKYAADDKERYVMMRALTLGWVQSAGIDSAKAFLSQQTDSSDYNGSYAALAESIGPSNPAEMNDCLKKIDDPILKEASARVIISNITDSNPDVASKMWADLLNSTPATSNEAVMVKRFSMTVPLWAAKDPAAATIFVKQLSGISEKARQTLLQQIAPTSQQ